MMNLKQTSELLRKAESLIKQRGRAQFVYEQTSAGRLCLVGAVRMACHQSAYEPDVGHSNCPCGSTLMWLRQQMLGSARGMPLLVHHLQMLEMWADGQPTDRLLHGLRWAADKADQTEAR